MKKLLKSLLALLADAEDKEESRSIRPIPSRIHLPPPEFHPEFKMEGTLQTVTWGHELPVGYECSLQVQLQAEPYWGGYKPAARWAEFTPNPLYIIRHNDHDADGYIVFRLRHYPANLRHHWPSEWMLCQRLWSDVLAEYQRSSR